MEEQDRVYALHDFEAENPDEVSFRAGETVFVVEKDDAYGDGWWQGTNERGETGLFPFSYTTYEKELVLSSRAGNAIVGLPSNGAGLGIAGSANDHIGAGSGVQTPQGKGAENGKTGVMHSTMADIDEALTELQGENKGKSKDAGSREARVRTSFASERTADFDADAATEEGDGNESDEFERRAAARAALAVNAKKNLAASAEREAAEMERMRADAARHFEEEEARERALLEKERERKAAAAAGVLPSNDSAPKVAPIPGVAISDESDSEGSEGDLHDLDPKTHSPLFGQQQQQNEPQANKSITAASQPPAASEQLQTSNINADKVVEQPNTSLGQLVEKPSSGALLSPIPSSTNPSPEPTTSAPLTTTAPSETALAAGSLVAGGPLAAVTLSSPSDPQSQISQQQQQRAFDERSLSSSRGRGSLTADSTNGGTAATSIITSGMPGPETPKSQVNTGTLGPTPGPTSPAVSIGRPAGAPSDPHEWNVENVVEWGRMKGWDQATVLDKFIEHEITGDVLLEMDINILKEIDITAFGKRFQVANAIKELKRPFGSSAPQTSLPAPNARSDSGSSPVDPSSGVLPAMHGLSDLPSSSTSHAGLFSSATQLSPAFVPALQGLYPPGSFGPGSTNMVSSYSSPHGYGLGAPADLRAAGSGTGLVRRDSDPTADARMSRSSDTSRRRSRPQSIAPESPASLPGLGSGWPPGQGPHARSGTGETFHTLDTALGRGDGREVLAERDVMSDSESPADFAERAFNRSRRASRSQDGDPAPLSSPRKRESSNRPFAPGGGERTSFFGIGPRNRKPPPKFQGAQDDDRGSRTGTFSRLGFGTQSKRQTKTTSSQDIRGQISLPTSSPQYDDTRRSRASAASGGSDQTGTPNQFGQYQNEGRRGYGHAKQASLGSGPPTSPRASGGTSAAVVAPSASAQGQSGSQQGPVMQRIRPVDLEGWMRKKGERYNSWKPRYLALKGADLVVLRDPSAEKIKGYVSMKGYKVIADENTNPGKYGFKILHEHEKPHYFSSDDPVVVREWMKSLMKATIGRDHSFPVISSYNNATMSLKEAQRMNPPPRPPSPTSRARTQRARARENPDQLTAKDAAVLMGLSSPQKGAQNMNMSQVQTPMLGHAPGEAQAEGMRPTNRAQSMLSGFGVGRAASPAPSPTPSPAAASIRAPSPSIPPPGSAGSSYPYFNFGGTPHSTGAFAGAIPLSPGGGRGGSGSGSGSILLPDHGLDSSSHERQLSLTADSEASFPPTEMRARPEPGRRRSVRRSFNGSSGVGGAGM